MCDEAALRAAFEEEYILKYILLKILFHDWGLKPPSRVLGETEVHALKRVAMKQRVSWDCNSLDHVCGGFRPKSSARNCEIFYCCIFPKFFFGSGELTKCSSINPVQIFFIAPGFSPGET